MFVIKKLRLNRFQPQPVVSPRKLYKLYGESDPVVQSKQTAENLEDVIPIGQSKTKLLALAKDVSEKALEFKSKPEETHPLSRRDVR